MQNFSRSNFYIIIRKILFISTCYLLITCEFTLNGCLYANNLPGEITNIEISNDKEEFLVSFTVKNSITNEYKEILKSGIALKFIYEIEIGGEGIIRDRIYLSESISYHVNYDNLRDEIRVIKLNSQIRVINLKDFDETESIIFSNQVIRINKRRIDIKRGNSYFVRIRCIIDRMESNVSLRFPLFFQSKRITSNWNELKFIY